MSRGQLPKAYLRIDPALAFTHPRADIFLRLLCLANMQPARGRFRDWTLLCSLFAEPDASFLRDRGDLVEVEDGRWYVAGWDEWQEGDLEVGERMRRCRARRRNTGVTEPSPNRIAPSEASRRQGVTTESPPSPPAGGGGDPVDPEGCADVCTATRPAVEPELEPGASAAPASRADRRRRALALRDDASAAERYWIELGGHPGPNDRRQIREALRAGRPLEQLLGSIAERARDELIAAGRLGPVDSWPPPEPRPEISFTRTQARASPGELAEVAAAWERLSEALRARLGLQAWATWIRPCRGLWLREGRLQLEVPGAQHLDWIGRTWSAELQWAAGEAGLEGVDLVMPPARAAGE